MDNQARGNRQNIPPEFIKGRLRSARTLMQMPYKSIEQSRI